ncbi:hypothetical protein AMD24_00209 [Candidatus Xiphinematobacter sp. Idaho Grape]|uniref:hypothetical protein n=1 Tax=Candidatus Xiphinematobacter sp. Idaho Grape TaxID=1704307 RepID=UPI000706D932|nr:hypothetical protein [Candidatus Xiphinematobacter sp. Idaho Grape]ALJ56398.1 hypothetical protein AMD24_00209 [Candidatus Xiphinematobacter sp. Idaho Grape]
MPRVLLLANFLCSTLFPFEESSRLVPNGKLDLPVPLNEDVIGIRVPYYNEMGRLEAQFDAHLVRKTDETHAIFTDLVVYLLEENNHPFHIDIPSGTLDLYTHILSGCGGIILHRRGICAVAQSVVFLARERLVSLKGDVKITIHNSGQPTGILQTWK